MRLILKTEMLSNRSKGNLDEKICVILIFKTPKVKKMPEWGYYEN